MFNNSREVRLLRFWEAGTVKRGERTYGCGHTTDRQEGNHSLRVLDCELILFNIFSDVTLSVCLTPWLLHFVTNLKATDLSQELCLPPPSIRREVQNLPIVLFFQLHIPFV